MPGSSSSGKETILQWFSENKSEIKKILDIGPGWGTYFDLFKPISNKSPHLPMEFNVSREVFITSIHPQRKLRGILGRCGDKAITWDCVEIWEPYIYRFKLYKKYINIFIKDILYFSPNKTYDLVILGDILEHIPKEQAIKVLENIRKFCKYYIISLPLDAETNASPGTGDKDWGNPYEVHKAKWSHKEFKALAFANEFLIAERQGNGELGVYIGKSSIFNQNFIFNNPTSLYQPRNRILKEIWYNKFFFFNYLKRLIPVGIKERLKKWHLK